MVAAKRAEEEERGRLGKERSEKEARAITWLKMSTTLRSSCTSHGTCLKVAKKALRVSGSKKRARSTPTRTLVPGPLSGWRERILIRCPSCRCPFLPRRWLGIPVREASHQAQVARRRCQAIDRRGELTTPIREVIAADPVSHSQSVVVKDRLCERLLPEGRELRAFPLSLAAFSSALVGTEMALQPCSRLEC